MNTLLKLSKLENVSVDFNSRVKGQNAQSVFCENWENAKVALGAIAAMVKNPVVKLILDIVISVGDGIKNKTCTV